MTREDEDAWEVAWAIIDGARERADRLEAAIEENDPPNRIYIEGLIHGWRSAANELETKLYLDDSEYADDE